jgi:Protein of unknown function (DUF3152)
VRAPGPVAVVGAAAIILMALVSCSSGGHDRAGSAATTSARTPSAAGSSGPTVQPAPSSPARPPKQPAPAVRTETVGSGHFAVVPGQVGAPGRGTLRTVRVEIEGGVPVDPGEFAAFVMATLNDSRSWGHGGTTTFARTAGPAQIVVRLASPETSAALCRPLVTFGRLSCSEGQFAILTSYRWFHGQSEFNGLTQYRQYVVNHEVGHVLGHGHLHCGGAGQLAPVMQQQTKGVAPCRPNAWPFP